MSRLAIFRCVNQTKYLGLVLIIVVGFLTSFEPSAYADAVDLRFCVVPVKDGVPTATDINEAWRITNVHHRIPGLPSLIFTPQNRGGQWTIDANRRLVPYNGLFPRTFFDRGRWVLEPWSSRVVAVTTFGGISFLRPGGTRFEEFDHGRTGPTLGVYLLPRRHLTVVTSSQSGPLIVGERELTPWFSTEQLSAHNVHGIFSIHDAPSLNAAIVLDLDGNVHVLTDDDQWFQVGTLSRNDHGIVFDAPGSNGALYRTGSSTLFIHQVDHAPGLRFRADVLRSTPAFGAGQVFPVAKLFGQVLTFSSGGWFGLRERWRRLTLSGFEDIAGGDIGLSDPRTFPYGRIDDLTTIGRTLIEGRDGLFLYDGQKITPVLGGDRPIVGKGPLVYDLASIGHVVVATRNGMFELTKAGTLVALSMPFPADGLPLPDVIDWPESGVALVSTRAGLFTIDSDLKATPVLGGDAVSFGWLNPATDVNPATGEMVLTGSRALFLAVDAQRSHDGTCREAQKLANQTPDSNLCLRPIRGANAASIGDVVGEMIAAPGDRGVLFDSVRGLFELDSDDKITQLESRGEKGDRFTRSLARLPWSGEVIAAGTVETVVHNDMSVQLVARSQHSDFLDVFPSIRAAAVVADSAKGPIQLVRLDGDRYRRVDTALARADVAFTVDAPWFGGPLVETRRGPFLMNRDGQLTTFELQNLRARLPSLFNAVRPFVIDRFRTIYVWRDGWFRITENRELLPVRGLPQRALVNASLDPGWGSVLLATSEGLFAMDQDGNASNLGVGGRADHVNFRSLARTPNEHVILAGSVEGLFRIDLDNYGLQEVPNGSKDTIGAVLDITASQYASLDIVDASNGTYLLSDSGLQLIHDLSAASNRSRVFVFEQQHRMLVTRRGDILPVLYEIGRRDSGGACQRELK
jgi:hypothetical protein